MTIYAQFSERSGLPTERPETKRGKKEGDWEERPLYHLEAWNGLGLHVSVNVSVNSAVHCVRLASHVWIEAKTRNYLVVAAILKEKSGEILGADIPLIQNFVKFPSGIEPSSFPSGVVEPPVNLGI